MGFCEYSKEPSGSFNAGNYFLSQLSENFSKGKKTLHHAISCFRVIISTPTPPIRLNGVVLS